MSIDGIIVGTRRNYISSQPAMVEEIEEKCLCPQRHREVQNLYQYKQRCILNLWRVIGSDVVMNTTIETELINKDENSSGGELVAIKEKIKKWKRIAELVIGLGTSIWIFVGYSIAFNSMLTTKYYVGWGQLESDSTVTVNILIDIRKLSDESQSILESGGTVSLAKSSNENVNSDVSSYITHPPTLRTEFDSASSRNLQETATTSPTMEPTFRPTTEPSARPTTRSPTVKPSAIPTTAKPSVSSIPSKLPTVQPSTREPSARPTPLPTTTRPTRAPIFPTYQPTFASGPYYQCYDMDGFSVHHGKQVATAWLDLTADDDTDVNNGGTKQSDFLGRGIYKIMIGFGLCCTGMAFMAAFGYKVWKEYILEPRQTDEEKKNSKNFRYLMDVILTILPFVFSVLVIPLSSFVYTDGICLHTLEGMFMPMHSLVALFTTVTCLMLSASIISCCAREKHVKILWGLVVVFVLVGQGFLGFAISCYQSITQSLPNYLYSINVAVNAVVAAFYFV